ILGRLFERRKRFHSHPCSTQRGRVCRTSPRRRLPVHSLGRKNDERGPCQARQQGHPDRHLCAYDHQRKDHRERRALVLSQCHADSRCWTRLLRVRRQDAIHVRSRLRRQRGEYHRDPRRSQHAHRHGRPYRAQERAHVLKQERSPIRLAISDHR
ncbi:hypothetical protein PENTCL1PPCAC_14373, partial [Pristionchus entomophagus]